MTRHIVIDSAYVCSIFDLDRPITQVIEIFKTAQFNYGHLLNAKIDVDVDDESIHVVYSRRETTGEYKERMKKKRKVLASNKKRKTAQDIAEQKEYLRLKKKFEGNNI